MILDKENILRVKKELINYPDALIVAATKYVDATIINELIDMGITDFGENRVEALIEKQTLLKDKNITWHFIGTLQTKKVKEIINDIDYLHSLCSVNTCLEIQKRSFKVINCFIEVNFSGEKSKSGIQPSEIMNFLETVKKCDKIRIVGLMTMAPNIDDFSFIGKCFKDAFTLKEKIRKMNLEYAPCEYLSMGMSNDYPIALENGATHIRLGHVLFKEE